MSLVSSDFDWNHVRTFLSVIEEGSLSAAARALGQTQPTVSRHISTLEAALNASLFIRGTREATLTETGTALFDQVQAMATAATQISRIATGRNQTVEGTIRITATDALVAYVLPQCLNELRAQHPGIHVELVSSMSQADIGRHEADIAIRHVRPEQPDLFAQWIGDFDVSLFASTEYLGSLNNLESLEGLARANFIGYEHPERLVQQVRSLGIPVTKNNFKIVATSGLVTYELARAGLGIALLPTAVAMGHFGLEKIHTKLGETRMPIWLVTHSDVKTNARIRLCFDLIAKALKAFQSGNFASLKHQQTT